MKLLIDNNDGLGQQDYSAYLDAENLPKIKRELNRAAKMQVGLASGDATFRVPASGARVVLQRDDGYKLFTGYLTIAPQLEYLGAAQAGRVWRYALTATDDSWLLDHNAPTARTPFVYRMVGDALRTITNDVLPGVLDVTGVQDLGYVNQYVASSQKSWSEHAQALATMERACYRVSDGKLIFQPVGQQSFSVSESDAKFSPDGLTVVQPDCLNNDATIVGELEPTAYVRDYFIGDGTTLGFYLSRSPFARATVTVFEEDYAGSGLSPTLWYVTDPNSKVGVASGQLQINGGPATVELVEQVELAGGLRIQHGQVTFSASVDAGRWAGFTTAASRMQIAWRGSALRRMGATATFTALINGAGAGAALATQPGHEYELVTQLFANEAHRVRQTYCSSAHGGGEWARRGHDCSSDARRAVGTRRGPEQSGDDGSGGDGVVRRSAGLGPGVCELRGSEWTGVVCASGVHAAAADGECRGAEHDSGTSISHSADRRVG